MPELRSGNGLAREVDGDGEGGLCGAGEAGLGLIGSAVDRIWWLFSSIGTLLVLLDCLESLFIRYNFIFLGTLSIICSNMFKSIHRIFIFPFDNTVRVCRHDDGKTTMFVHERKATLREFYA